MTAFPAAMVAFSLVVGLTACGDSTTGEAQPTAATAPPSTLPAMPAGDAAIEPGTYHIPSSDWSVVDFTVTFPAGWTVQYGHVYAKHQDEDDEFGFYAVLVDEIYTDACRGEGVPRELGPRVDDLVAALLQQPGPATSGPVDTTLGGYPATRIDLTTPQALDLESCRLHEAGVDGLQIWYSTPADKYFVLVPDGGATVYILDVDGERQVFLTQHRSATSDEDRAELQAILDSIRIGA